MGVIKNLIRKFFIRTEGLINFPRIAKAPQHFLWEKRTVNFAEATANFHGMGCGQGQNERLLEGGQTIGQRFTHTVAAPHVGLKGADTGNGDRGRNPIIHRCQPHRLVPPSAGSRGPDAIGHHIIQGSQEIDRPHVVDELDSHQTLTDIPQRRPQHFAMVFKLTMDGCSFPGTEGIDREAYEAIFGEGMAATLDPLGQAPLRPMTMQIQDGGKRPRTLGNIQVAGHIKSRAALKIDVFDRIAIARDRAGFTIIQIQILDWLRSQGLPDSLPQSRLEGHPFLGIGWELVDLKKTRRLSSQD